MAPGQLVETYDFESVFNDNREFLKVSSEIEESRGVKFFKNISKFYNPTNINSKCYSYSFLNRFYIFRKTETNLAEVKSKFYDNRKRYIKGTGINTSTKTKINEKKQTMLKATQKGISNNKFKK